jgi:hypothetical protein
MNQIQKDMIRNSFRWVFVSCIFFFITTGCATEVVREVKYIPQAQSLPPQIQDLPLGTRVRRGPDWKWGNQDGGTGNMGTVKKSKDRDGWVTVKWDNGIENNYRWTGDGKYDLEIISFSSPSPKTDDGYCSLLYKIYKQCYGAGIGSDIDNCAALSATIIVEFGSKLPSDMSTALGLLCGVACSEGTSDGGLPSYIDFKHDRCDN